jgi:hypothetical protein
MFRQIILYNPKPLESIRMQVSTQALTLLGFFLVILKFFRSLGSEACVISLLGDIKTKDLHRMNSSCCNIYS